MVTTVPCGAVAVLLALAAAALSGSGDFLGGLASRRGRVMAVVFVNHVAGVFTVLAVGPVFGGSLDGQTILWGSFAGLSGSLAVLALYSGFARSSIAVVSPIAAVGAGAWPALWEILGGDVPGPIVVIGLVIGLVAIWTISSGGHIHEAENVRTGVIYGVLAGLGFGGLLIFLSLSSDSSGIWAMLPARLVGAMVLLVVVSALHRDLLPERHSLPPSIGSGVLVTLGNGLFLLAITKGALAVVSVIAAMFPATTVILAWFVLGERLTPQRRVGLVLALVAVGLVAGG
jgi:drug/metabolite transporter (DMT)-like permease